MARDALNRVVKSNLSARVNPGVLSEIPEVVPAPPT